MTPVKTGATAGNAATNDRDDPSLTDAADPFASAAAALDGAGLRWCRLRERGDGLEDDLLVAQADREAASRALEGVGWLGIRHAGHGTHRWFHLYDPVLDRWLRLDLVVRLDHGRWQEWRSGLADGCLARSQIVDGRRRLAPDDAFWTLFLHETLDRPGIEPRRIDDLQRLAASALADGEAARSIASILPRGWHPDRVIGAALAGNGAALRAVGIAATTRLGRRPSVRRRRLTSQVLRWLDHRDPPFLRRGRTVALLGPDGAGKSSLATRIGQGGPLLRRSVYLGLYGGARARLAPDGGRRRLPGIGLARRLMAMWRGWLIGWWAAKRGRIVIFDRHPYDARLGDARGPGARLRRTLLGRALPAPDLIVILDAPAELLYARKPEHPLDRIESQRRRYLALADRIDRVAVVDASAPLDEVARRITALVWRGIDEDRAR